MVLFNSCNRIIIPMIEIQSWWLTLLPSIRTIAAWWINKFIGGNNEYKTKTCDDIKQWERQN
ncbi:MAG: hypothetical protein ACTS44_01095 [Candidatus Hodgkinia cicadicola]